MPVNGAQSRIKSWQGYSWGLTICLIVSSTLAGCSLFNSEKDASNTPLDRVEKKTIASGTEQEQTRSKSEEVRFDGGLLLGNTDNLAQTPETLGAEIVQLVNQEKFRSLEALVQRYPDVTNKLLIEANGESVSWPHLAIVARFFDFQWQSQEGVWQDFVSRLSTEDAGVTAKRREFLGLLMNNQPSKALELGLVGKLKSYSPMIIRAESNRLEGIAMLMLERYESAIGRFESALDILGEQNPYMSSQIGLLLGEAYRHQGDKDEWSSSWNHAVLLQSRWLEQDGVRDPAFWQKAAFLRPASTDWSADVINKMTTWLARHGLEIETAMISDNEAILWALIGRQSLDRHESQNAILAFKKAEALAKSQPLRKELRLNQALAMIDGGQNGPASAILLNLGSSKGLLSDRAKAVLAALKLQNGSIAQGMNLLQSAIKSSGSWPNGERAKAQADYGLALLIRGRENDGIAMLETTFESFVEQGNHEHAALCLWNMAKYYETKENVAMYQTSLQRIERFEANFGTR